MTDLVAAASLAAWGDVFLLFNIDFNGFGILPNFVGYLLFFLALRRLSMRPQPAYLQGLCLLLLVYNLLDYWPGLPVTPGLFGVYLLLALVNLYFLYQFLAVMAALAADYQPLGDDLAGRIMSHGKIFIGMQLAAFLGAQFYRLTMLKVMEPLLIVLAVALVIIGLLVMWDLFYLRKILSRQEQVKETLPEGDL